MIEKITQKVKTMIEGEKKRREIARKWLAEITPILEELSEELWGSSPELWYRSIDDTLMFVYGDKCAWEAGFYLYQEDIEDYRGRVYWMTVEAILDWLLNNVIPSIDCQSKYRDQILSKIVV